MEINEAEQCFYHSNPIPRRIMEAANQIAWKQKRLIELLLFYLEKEDA